MATRKSPASAEKKTTTRKAPTKKAAAASAEPLANLMAERHAPSYDEIAQLSHQLWVERGRPYGSPEVDWLRAEARLHA